jgi:hypothetical protein
MNIKWTITSRGGRALYIENYKFVTNKTSQTRTYWKCANLQCCVKAISVGNDIVSVTHLPHNHESDLSSYINIRLKELFLPIIRQKPFKSAYSIYQQAREELIVENEWREEIFTRIPIYESIKNAIYRIKENYIPATNNLFFEIAEEYTRTLNNRQF